MSIREKNRFHNAEFSGKINGMINGQSTGIIPDLRYGLFSMSYNGCEVIAVYNALVYLNKNMPLDEVSYIMEKHRILLGAFGSNPYCFDKLGDSLSLKAERIYKTDGISAFIISLWCGKPFFSGIHTMFCILDKGRITVYNRYNQDIHERIYPDFKSFAGNRKIISIYSVAV